MTKIPVNTHAEVVYLDPPFVLKFESIFNYSVGYWSDLQNFIH